MDKLTVLVVGSGGRCHAIVDALSHSNSVGTIFCAPANAGIAECAQVVPIKETEVDKLKEFAIDNKVDLTIVGPEVSLAAGIVDEFRSVGLRIFGHTRAAARIETSKEFAKELMLKYDIPTAGYRVFSSYDKALAYVTSRPLPAVLKYDGLAAGKGVVIAETIDEADAALKDMLLDDRFGKGQVIVEDYLCGQEFSFMCFVDGDRLYPMPLAQDHKRAFDGDKGPNTGGMGAYTRLPFITEEIEKYAFERIMLPTAKAMVAEGYPLSGVLYGGLMLTQDGVKVIEFNARFGDPETEVVLPLLKSDICDIFCNIADGKPLHVAPEWENAASLGIVLASKGYPDKYEKGAIIRGTECVNGIVYHMGTARSEGNLVTAGGRVMIIVCKGETLRHAQECARKEVARISCDNLFYRSDIGDKAFL